MTRFGPSGNDSLFYEQGFKSTVQAPEWVAGMGLSAFEINFGRGIRMSEETARAIGEQAAKHDVLLSAHAPYFINLARDAVNHPEGLEKGYGYIEKSLMLLKVMGGRNLVVHIGSQVELEREVAVANCKANLETIMKRLDAHPNLKDFDFRICIETMGRYAAIGNHEEVCDICSVHPKVIPTLDFGHMNCLMQGGLREEGAIERIMDYCMQHVGREKMQNVHIHFSPIKFGAKGELGHLNFDIAPEIFTPPFEPLAKYIKANKLNPTVICESAEVMAQDAVRLRAIFVEC